VGQTFFQRIMGVGTVAVSSSGQSGIEILADGIRSPDRVRQLISDCRSGTPPAPPQAILPAQPHPASPPSAAQPTLQPVAPPKPQTESYFASDRFKESLQSFLDHVTYIGSLRWVALLPDWAQPIVWGLIVSVPLILMLVLVFRVLGR
jgi:hypothetical protein